MKERSLNVLCKFLFVTMVLVMLTPQIVHAQQDTDARIEKLEAAVKALQAELAALKAERARERAKPAPIVDQKQIDQMVSKAIEDKKTGLGVPDWVNNFKFLGDLRYRYEWIDDEEKTADQNRNRVRLRFGFKAKVNEEVDAIVRLGSGSEDPASTNQTLDSGFTSKDIWLDWAYFDYHPTAIEGLNAYGGKMKNPFFAPGKSEILWDHDLSPEGLAATLTHKINDDIKAFGTFGGFYLEERSGDADSSLWGLQGGLTYNFPDAEKTYLTAGGGYFDFGNVKGETVFDFATSTAPFNSRGNTQTAGGEYVNDYDVVEVFGEFGFPYAGLSVKVFGDFIKNVSATSSGDTGYLFGASIGKCKKPGSWQARYNYRRIKSDATIGAFSDSDFIGGGTAGRGHELGFAYQLAKNWLLSTTYFLNKTLDTKKDYNRLQVDLKYKF